MNKYIRLIISAITSILLFVIVFGIFEDLSFKSFYNVFLQAFSQGPAILLLFLNIPGNIMAMLQITIFILYYFIFVFLILTYVNRRGIKIIIYISITLIIINSICFIVFIEYIPSVLNERIKIAFSPGRTNTLE